MWLRRLLWPIRVGGVLERHLQCVPVREPTRMRLVEVLRADPRSRSTVSSRPSFGPPSSAGPRSAVDRPRSELAMCCAASYADLLWTVVERDQVARHGDVWRDHLRAAVRDFGQLVNALQSGGLVVIYPEGELSPDGRIAPLKPGLASLARRGRARLVQPVAVSYDPLAGGRARAYVSVAQAIVPAPGRLTER